MPISIEKIRIYHILHKDRLRSVLCDGFLWSNEIACQRNCEGTEIGLQSIKSRRMKRPLGVYGNLTVGECVPFYFCYRSIMLCRIAFGHSDYRGGQDNILHLVARLEEVLYWARRNHVRRVFTLTGAGKQNFKDYANIKYLERINWNAVKSRKWRGPGVPWNYKKDKQAEFLIEKMFPWELVCGIGTRTEDVAEEVRFIIKEAEHRPPVMALPNWYYEKLE